MISRTLRLFMLLTFILSLTFSLAPSAQATEPALIGPPKVFRPDPAITIVPQEPVSSCIVAGCSGELCVDPKTGPTSSICLWNEEYACLKHARCERQANGACGWTETPQSQACRQGAIPTPKPLPSPSTAPTCGNQICEPGEADESFCPPCTGDVCPLAPCYYKPGSCPQDCAAPNVSLTPAPQPTCVPRPPCLDAKPHACDIAEPDQGWCSPGQPGLTPAPIKDIPTLTPTPQPPRYWPTWKPLPQPLNSVIPHASQTAIQQLKAVFARIRSSFNFILWQ